MLDKAFVFLLLVGMTTSLVPVIGNLYGQTKLFSSSYSGQVPALSRTNPNTIYSIFPGYGSQTGILFAQGIGTNSITFISPNLGWFYGETAANRILETGYLSPMSNDDMFTWSDQARSIDGSMHINIVRNVTYGTARIAGKHALPGSNSTYFSISSSGATPLPNDRSGLIAYSTGYYYVDFSNENSISSQFVNLTDSIPNLRQIQAITVLRDNTTIIFAGTKLNGNLFFQEGILQSNGSISLARSLTVSDIFTQGVFAIGVDYARNIVYASVSTNLVHMYLSNWTAGVHLNLQSPPFAASGFQTGNPPWISPDGLTMCINLNYGNFIVNVTNPNNLTLINSYQGQTNPPTNWCALRTDRQVAFSHAAYLFNASSTTSPINTIRSYRFTNGLVEMLTPFPCDNQLMIACGKMNVFIYNISNPNTPVQQSEVDYGSFTKLVGGLCDHVDFAKTSRGIIVGGALYTNNAIEITEFNNTNAPFVLNQFKYMPTFTNLGQNLTQTLSDAAISVEGDMLVGLSTYLLMAHNISNPLNPILVASLTLPSTANCKRIYKFRTRGPTYIVNCATGNAFLIVSLNLTNGGFSILSNVSLGLSFDAYSADTAISASEQVVYIMTFDHRLISFNVSDLSNPVVLSNVSLAVDTSKFKEEEIILSQDESLLLVLGETSEIAVYNISQPSNIRFMGFFPTVARAGSAALSFNNGAMFLYVGGALSYLETHNFGTYTGEFLSIRNQNYCTRYGPTPAPTPIPPTPPTPPTPTPSPNTQTSITSDETTTTSPSDNNVTPSDSGLGNTQTIVIAVVAVVVVCCICFIILIIVVIRIRRRRAEADGVELTAKTAPPTKVRSNDTVYSGMQPGDKNYQNNNNNSNYVKNEINNNASPLTNSYGVPVHASRGEYQTNANERPLRRSNAERVQGSPLRILTDSELIVSSQQLGKGAFGMVFAGTVGNQKVAVKEFNSELPEVVSEARMMSAVPPHPNVVTLIGVIYTPRFRVVTELMAGGDLRSYFQKNKGSIPMNQKMIWISGIASGMEHLMKQGILHRDLAARNVLLDGQLNAKVSDFGLSKVVESKKDAIYSTSNVGPLRWMAPEALERKKYSEKSDVWSFGVVCYEIICEVNPYFEIDDAVRVAGKVAHNTIRLEFPKGLPNGLNSAVSLIFSFEAEDRPTFSAIIKLLQS